MAAVAEPDLGRLLLEGHRAVAADLVALLDERGFPGMRAGHAALFLHIDDLEGRGYVRRVPDQEDARAKVVRLTARGRRCAAESRRAVQALESRTRRLLGDRRYESLRESIEELVVASREDLEIET
jgi:DNA-binding PadR family transcriptional regulator